MNMSFDRNRAQIRCEGYPRCNPTHDLKSAQQTFSTHRLSIQDAHELENSLTDDAHDFYFKGVLSLCQACCGVQNNQYSWSTVQLYYALYYLLRCSLATRKIAIIRFKSLWYLKARSGELPKTISGRDGNSTHKGTIKVYTTLFQNSDFLHSNDVQGKNGYMWLLECRERIQYRERSFHDPHCPDIWEQIALDKDSNGLNEVLARYIDDSESVYCFQRDHACLAFPIRRLFHTRQDILNANIERNFSSQQENFLRTMLDASNLQSLKNLILE